MTTFECGNCTNLIERSHERHGTCVRCDSQWTYDGSGYDFDQPKGELVNDFDKARKNLETIERLEAEIAALKVENSTLLAKVKAERGVSFQAGEKFYSIRCRAGNNFLVSSDVAFGSWLKKDKVAE